MHHLQLDIAKKCGADVILNPSKCNLDAEVRKLTEGYGCDVYIEATGHPNSVSQGYVPPVVTGSTPQHTSPSWIYLCVFSWRLQVIARHGRFVEFSVFGKEVTTDWTVIGDAKGKWV